MASSKKIRDREALEKFKKEHPELASVPKIANMPEKDFVQKYVKAFNGDSKQAKQVHKTAKNIQQKTALLWANIKDAVASPYYGTTLFNNIPQEFIDHIQSIPGYDRLFGNLDFIECDHCRSIFGPAAYFVDLMRFIEINITKNTNNYNSGEHGATIGDCKLEKRRSDLFKMKLDCHNTYDLIPYIDLIIEGLESFISDKYGQSAYKLLADAVFPMNLPFNLPLEEIRAYLKQLKTSLYYVYKTFEKSSSNDKSPVTREFLELSPKEFSLIISEISSPDEVLKYYGDDENWPITLTGSEGLENVKIFQQQTGLSREELNELIYQDLDYHEMNAGLSRLFFINNVNDGMGHLEIIPAESDSGDPYEKLVNLSYKKLDRIYRFLKLSRKLGWTFTELDWALRSLTEPYTPEKVLKFDGINDYIACHDVSNLDEFSFTIEAWINPERSGKNIIVSKGSESDSQSHFTFFINEANKLAFFSEDVFEKGVTTQKSDPRPAPSGRRTIHSGVFTHVAVTFTEAHYDVEGNIEFYIKFYVNGELDNIVSTNNKVIPFGTDFNISKDLGEEYFAGIIKEVRIWKGDRDQSAIEQDRYRRLTGLENDLLGYWPLIESNGDKIYDLTPYRNDGLMGDGDASAQPTWVERDLILDPLPEPVAYQFNGEDQYLAASEVSGFEASELTIEAWIRLEDKCENYIICKGNESKSETQFMLYVNSDDKLVFESSSLNDAYYSNNSIKQRQLTHVCVTVSETTITIYLNGLEDCHFNPGSSIELVTKGNDLYIGRSFDGKYYNGFIKDVRIWSIVRTSEQIIQSMNQSLSGNEPYLIGYWRLNEIDQGTAKDFSNNYHNHLYLGGIPEWYMPDRVDAELVLPYPPIKTEANVLQFDGDDDVAVIIKEATADPEEFTLEFWFNADEINPTEKTRVILSQGDNKSGLNVYIFNELLHIYAWYTIDGQPNPQDAIISTKIDAIESNKWHHLTITYDKNTKEIKCYLDGDDSPFEDNTAQVDVSGTWLPAGPIYLGKDIEDTRFHDDVKDIDAFKGNIADFRLWKKVKTAEEIKAIPNLRYTALIEKDPDLVAYLPMNDGTLIPQIITISEDKTEIYNQVEDKNHAKLIIGGDDPGDKWVPADVPIEDAETALELDGIDDYVELPQCITSKTGTIELLLKFSSLDDQRIFDASTGYFLDADHPDNEKFFIIEIKDKKLVFNLEDIQDDPNFEDACYTLDESFIDRWFHIAAIWNYDKKPVIQLYIDVDGGKLIAPENRDPKGFPKFRNPYLGKSRDVKYHISPGLFQGQISEVRIWNTVRTEDEIKNNLSHRLIGDETDLMFYWIFEENKKITILSDKFNGDYKGILGDGKWRQQPNWVSTTEYPILLDPFMLKTLKFDVKNQYLAAENVENLNLSQFSLEAWIKLESIGDNPIFSMGESYGSQAKFKLGIDQNGELSIFTSPVAVSKAQSTTIAMGNYYHIALSVNENTATFFINGQEERSLPLSPDEILMSGKYIEIGRDMNGAYFHGQIGEVRIWNVPKTEEQISQGMYQPADAGSPGLVGYWPFTEASGVEAKDFSANANHLRLGGIEFARWPVLFNSLILDEMSVFIYDSVVVMLDDSALQHIADIKKLKERTSLSMDKLCALWYQIKHTGKEDQVVLYDQIFNEKVMEEDRWEFYTDEPIEWDTTGENNPERSNRLRNRLIGALQVTNDDLNRIIDRLNGAETLVVLNNDYQTRLFRLAWIPRILGISIQEFLRLLEVMGLQAVNNIDDFLQLVNRADWMERTNIDIYELDFLSNDILSDTMAPGFGEDEIRTLADDLRNQSNNFLIQGNSFVLDEIDASLSIEIFNILQENDFIDEIGAVTPNYTQPEDLKPLIQANQWENIEDKITGILTQKRDELSSAIIAGLANLLGTTLDFMIVFVDYFSEIMSPAAFINLMIDMKEEEAVPSEITNYLYKHYKLTYLVGEFAFNPEEIRALLASPESFDVKPGLNPDVQDLDNLQTFKELKLEFNDTEGKIAQLFFPTDVDTDSIGDRIIQLTEWDQRQFNTLVEYLGMDSTSISLAELNQLKQCFDLAQSMGVAIDSLVQLDNKDNLTFEFYQDQSASLLKILRSHYDVENWQKVYQPIHGSLAEKTRDALLSLTMLVLGQDYEGRRSPDVLSEFFLLDLQMAHETETSRILQGISSLQLYVQRCQMNLEPGVSPDTIPPTEWEWMKNYRVWEANRKVFLYPENYIEPELRKIKTPIFEELEQELMQNQITEEAVTTVYKNYLNKFAEIANLKIVGSYLHPEPGSDESVLYLIGRTYTEPYIYYYRENRNGNQWLPWIKINLSIPPEFVTPIYAFNKLFIFWVEFIKTVKSVDVEATIENKNKYAGKWQGTKKVTIKDDTSNIIKEADYLVFEDIVLQENLDIYKPTIKYSYYDFHKNWIQPQTFKDFEKELTSDEMNQHQWQRVYAQRALQILTDTIYVEKYRFTHDLLIPAEVDKLNNDKLPVTIMDKFQENEIDMPGDCTLSTIQESKIWQITHEDWETFFMLRANGTELLIYEVLFNVSLNPLERDELNQGILPEAVKVKFQENDIDILEGYTIKTIKEFKIWKITHQDWEIIYYMIRTNGTEDVLPKKITKIEENAKVLQIDHETKIEKFIPDFDMDQLTWSFWANFENHQPGVDPIFTVDLEYQEVTELNNDALPEKVRLKFEGEEISTTNFRINKIEGFQLLLWQINDDNTSYYTIYALDERLDIYKVILFEITLTSNDMILLNDETATTLPDTIVDNLGVSLTNFTKTIIEESKLWQIYDQDEETTYMIRITGTDQNNDYEAEVEILMFKVDLKFQEVVDLDEGKLPDKIKNEIGIPSPEDVTIETIEESNLWQINHNGKTYMIDRLDNNLLVYDLGSGVKSVTLFDYDENSFSAIVNNNISRLPAAPGTSTPKWGSDSLTLKVRFPKQDLTIVEVKDLEYDCWQHIAITLDNSASVSPYLYVCKLYLHGKDGEKIVEELKEIQINDLLGSQQKLIIGKAEEETSKVFTAQMSEFRLWNKIRSVSEIHDGLNWRMDWEVGLLHIPMNESIPDWKMTLIASDLLFNYIEKFTMLPIPTEERERIIMFYGDDYKLSIRDNLIDQNFTLKLKAIDPDANECYDINLLDASLDIVETIGLSINDYAESGGSTITSGSEQNLLVNLSNHEATLIEVNNQPGWYILDTGEEQFLIKAQEELMTTMERTKFRPDFYKGVRKQAEQTEIEIYFNSDPALDVALSNSNVPHFEFERVSTRAIHELSRRLLLGGLEKFLSLESQQLEELNFGKKYQYNRELNFVIPPDYVVKEESYIVEDEDSWSSLADKYWITIDDLAEANPDLDINQPLTLDQEIIIPTRIFPIEFDGAYGLYYREIFFHIPFMIANKLNSNQKFAEAQKWYHYIFNPTALNENNNSKDRYWRYLPFRGLTLESLEQMLENEEALAEYREHPFDPHAIARLRVNAYQKTIVMKYIDNLLDWGDNLFSQDTRESINEAVQLYFLAYNLLGPKPEKIPLKQFKEVGDYETIREENKDIPEFLVELDNLINISPNLGDPAPTPNNNLLISFCIMENEQFMGYWDRVRDRLYKIRHSLNIEGVFRSLALFESPISPTALVAAAAGGRDISSALSDISVPVPHYRYSVMLEKAKDMASYVIDLGREILSALETVDNKKLAAMNRTHELNIYDMTTKMLEWKRDVADNAIEALNISRKSIERRKTYYSVIEGTTIGIKATSLTLSTLAKIFKQSEGPLEVSTELTGSLIPDVEFGGSGFGGSPVAITMTGGSKISRVTKASAKILNFLSSLFKNSSELVEKGGDIALKVLEFEHQKDIADNDLKNIDKQIANAKISRDIAEHELTLHKKKIQHLQEVEEFHRSKFTGSALYHWMIARLSSLYFQAYKIAYDMAKSAEKALHYELCVNSSYINFGHWDSLKKGLLAGESLMLDLRRMEKAHLDQFGRFLHIEKTISLSKSKDPKLNTAFENLTQNGECEFHLSEELFDRDYPGHYRRKINSLSISIKTKEELEPHQSINATLTQLGSKMVLEPNIEAVKYVMTGEGDDTFVRSDWRANQQIAYSKVAEDGAVFGKYELNFLFDQRYFPFEGTGAVSHWKLEIPQKTNEIDISNIEDVFITLKYTASPGGEKFKEEVEDLI